MTLRKLTSALLIALAMPVAALADSDRIVILHTNDTHSIIDPYHETGLGGVMRRKALIDSVRNNEPNVLLVDAGDVVQGSLYFTLFGGEVEQKVMNALGYDVQILGNHEFDNGMEPLRTYLEGLNADLITTNYDLTQSNISDLFKPYTIRSVGGKKIGLLAINVDPAGLIDAAKSQGVRYLDPIQAANAVAWWLRNIEKCDYVIALSHIGYEEGNKADDILLAEYTQGIDAIIGGHSHTLIDPSAPDAKRSRFANLAGDTVVVAQTGKYGANLGEVVINLNDNSVTSRVIPVTSRLDSQVDPQLAEILRPYKTPVDSINGIVVGQTSQAFNKKPQMMNWMADFVMTDAQRLAKQKIDMSIVNVGGIRSTFPQGNITKGNIMQTFPFDNHEVVLAISGAHLAQALDSIAATGGNGVSHNVRALMDVEGKRCLQVTIDGKPIDPNRTYYVATINYLAGGNDGMEPLKYGMIVARSDNYLYDDMLNAFQKGFLRKKKLRPDSTVRMKQ